MQFYNSQVHIIYLKLNLFENLNESGSKHLNNYQMTSE